MASKTLGSTGLAGRYATALFELADEENRLDQVAGDLKKMGEMIKISDDLLQLIRSPVLTRNEQMKAIDGLMIKTGMCDLLRRFIGVAVHNRRLFALPIMIDIFMRLLSKRRGETTAEVTSAIKLSPKQLESLAASLKKAIGGKVVIETKVDPDLLGGLIVKVGSRMVDSSLNAKLRQLRFAMIGGK